MSGIDIPTNTTTFHTHSCCEYGSYGVENFYCKLVNVNAENVLLAQEYLSGFEDNDYYWAFMMSDEMKDDMSNGAKTLALATASAVVIVSMF